MKLGGKRHSQGRTKRKSTKLVQDGVISEHVQEAFHADNDCVDAQYIAETMEEPTSPTSVNPVVDTVPTVTPASCTLGGTTAKRGRVYAPRMSSKKRRQLNIICTPPDLKGRSKAVRDKWREQQALRASDVFDQSDFLIE